MYYLLYGTAAITLGVASVLVSRKRNVAAEIAAFVVAAGLVEFLLEVRAGRGSEVLQNPSNWLVWRIWTYAVVANIALLARRGMLSVLSLAGRRTRPDQEA